MDNRDRQAIDDLFDKLAEVERRTPPRDAGAEDHIRARIAEQPAAPYYMAQTIVVQEQALEAAQRRIEELEQAVSRPQGFFGGLFGSPRQPVPARRQYGDGYGQQGYGRQPWGGQPAGGGFLAGAGQTALGVAGGLLLANVVMGAFAGSAAAAEADSGGDAGGDFDSGGGGDFGGGDFGGGDF